MATGVGYPAFHFAVPALELPSFPDEPHVAGVSGGSWEAMEPFWPTFLFAHCARIRLDTK